MDQHLHWWCYSNSLCSYTVEIITNCTPLYCNSPHLCLKNNEGICHLLPRTLSVITVCINKFLSCFLFQVPRTAQMGNSRPSRACPQWKWRQLTANQRTTVWWKNRQTVSSYIKSINTVYLTPLSYNWILYNAVSLVLFVLSYQLPRQRKRYCIRSWGSNSLSSKNTVDQIKLTVSCLI